jgi:hypothetical protein
MASTKSVHFDALRNALYHSARRGYFDAVNRILSLIIVAAGTGAVVNVGQLAGIPIDAAVFAFLAALAGLLQLVFDVGGKARIHEFLQRRFYEVVADVAEQPDADEKVLAKWQATLSRLYAEEPPPMRALDAIAYNAAVDSLGYPAAKRLVVKWYHSLMRNVLPFNGASFDYQQPDAKS